MTENKEVTGYLEFSLANSYALYLKTQNYHWNVEGEHFYSLHKLFEDQYEDLAKAVDEIAERIRALGAKAPGSFEKFAKLSVIKPGDENASWKQMVKNLADDHHILAEKLREAIYFTQKVGDDATMDMLTDRLKKHQHNVWLLRAHL